LPYLRCFVANISIMVTKVLWLAKLRKMTANIGRGKVTFFKYSILGGNAPLIDFRGAATPSAPGSDATGKNTVNDVRLFSHILVMCNSVGINKIKRYNCTLPTQG